MAGSRLLQSGWLGALAALITCTAAEGQLSVVPGSLLTAYGNFDNSIPWSDEAPVRYQQVLAGSQVGSMDIVEIRFRRDEVHGHPFSATLRGVTVTLSSTSVSPDELSLDFSENLGPDATVVFAGDLTLTSGADTQTPWKFDIFLRPHPWFAFDASSGQNLLIDVKIESGPPLTYFDAELTERDGTSRVYCWTEEACLTTNEAMFGDTVGLATMILGPFVFEDGFESADTSAWSAAQP